MPVPKRSTNQILLFPGVESSATKAHHHKGEGRTSVEEAVPGHRAFGDYGVALCGTYRKDLDGLKRIYEELLAAGCQVLSPQNVKTAREVDGFVYMEGEETQLPEDIESRHLEAIQNAHFVWLHAPDGYVGPTAALEVGFARAIGIPVFSRAIVKDQVLRSFVAVEESPTDVLKRFVSNQLPPPQPALKAFQNYYKRVALQRGYSKEDAHNCLLLMVEEVGELARAIRKRENLARHSPGCGWNEADELADVFLYVVHMANILNLDLSQAVSDKELLNLQKFLRG